MGAEDILMRVAAESPWALVAFYVLTRLNSSLEKLTRAVEDMNRNFCAQINALERDVRDLQSKAARS